MQAQLRYLKTAAAEIPYVTWEVDRPKAVMVFLHGLKSHSQWFFSSGEDFARQGVKPYVFDRRGSGRSTAARGDIGNYHDWLEDIHAVVGLAKQDNPGLACHLLGHCFGAKLALGYALLHPGEIVSLALIAPPQSAIKADITLWDKWKVACSLLPGVSCNIPVPVTDEMFTRDPAKLEFIQSDGLRLQEMTARFCLAVRKMDRWINRNLEDIRIPVFVLLAKEDPVVDNKKVRARFFPRLGAVNKKLSEFDCYHHLLFEPLRERVIEEITDWMRSG